jgi:glycosyltransferase involved in cell wall biosynthesis
MSSPLLTIGLPFYNNASTIEMALKSIFAQTFTDWQLILIDDGSLDMSSAIVHSLYDRRVKVIGGETNRGLVYRLNQIASIAQSKYIARMDADDLMMPNRLEKQVLFLEQNTSVDLVDTGTYSIDEYMNPIGKRGLSPINYNPAYIVKHTMLLHASIVGKKEWFKNYSYNENYPRAEDYELWCRTFRASSFSRIQELLYIVREGKVSLNNYIKGSETVRKIIKKYGPDSLSSLQIEIEMMKSHGKVFLYRIFTLLNAQDKLSSKRNDPLSEAEKIYLSKMLMYIKNIELPIRKHIKQ